MSKKIEMLTDVGTESFYVVEETRINGASYLLVAEKDLDEDDTEEEVEVFILKDVSADGDTEAVYVFVEDELELDTVSDLFARMMEGDFDLEK